VVVDVVCRSRVAVEGDAPETVAERGWHVGEETAPVGPEAIVQEKLTPPVNPPRGVRVIVEVDAAPGVANVTAVAEIPSEGAAVAAWTVIEAVVEAVILPVGSAAVMVTE
jgi:hypothetical protein